jgi:hypothetical protein
VIAQPVHALAGVDDPQAMMAAIDREHRSPVAGGGRRRRPTKNAKHNAEHETKPVAHSRSFRSLPVKLVDDSRAGNEAVDGLHTVRFDPCG